ncbi:aminoglycoside phosphotransferase family protein [Paenibacillus terrigena]|uniref:aminoglycoside phosphotransferase family protein n=1 Tax=Paenibacillus terrigena TaxID=369333 RepID=UPI000374EE0C|nr:aminoglycoside phosphotransferase family protein [Paenibacillus terrigena]
MECQQDQIKNIASHIPALQGYREAVYIDKGYSPDQKFMMRRANGDQVLLKVFPLQDYAWKEKEYKTVLHMAAYEVRCSRPIAIGQIPELGLSYLIISYLEGEDGEVVVPKLPEEVQAQIGYQAGEELLKITQMPAPSSISSWYDRKLRKHQRYVEQYRNCGYKVRNDEQVLAFIDKHIHLMIDRPNRFQHDDYHLGNLIIRDQQLQGVIDFSAFDWGDPVHEFVKIGIFCSETSVPFSIGQIRGYHQGEEPDELFWKLYALYLAMTIISSVVWVLKVKPEELDMMMDKINRVLDDHHDFDVFKPNWYV